MLTRKEQAILDARAAEKLKAHVEGRVPVFTTEAPLPVARSAADLDARAKAKLARHFAPPAPDKGEGGKASEDPAKDEEKSKDEKSSKEPEKKPAPDKGEGGKK